MSHELLRDAKFFAFLLLADAASAEEVRVAGCACGGPLHVANYPRKPRGGPIDLGPEHDRRLSFCCGECRKRATPPSVRFLGRKVYLGAFVVLVSTMRQGPTPARVAILRATFGIAERTLRRWMHWWREVFPASEFWRGARGFFLPPVDSGDLPLGLLGRFAGEDAVRLGRMLRFLAPLTTTWSRSAMAT